MSDDTLAIGKHRFGSRLIVGTGKYKDVDETARAIAASGAELVTVALRRVNLQDRGEGSMMSLLTRGSFKLLAQHRGLLHRRRSGAHVPARARARASPIWSSSRSSATRRRSFPTTSRRSPRPRSWWRKASPCCPYCIDDPIVCRKLEDIGCAAVMPLAAPIGSGLGIRNPHNLAIILEHAKVPVIVDAGVGTASDAAVAMELGCHGVLMNTAIAGAKNPVLMAEAMREAVIAGRKAFLAGRIPKKLYATASSPESGLI